MAKHAYGWRPDLPDQRDHRLLLPPLAEALPKKISLRPKTPPVYDQSNLGSCDAHWVAANLEYDAVKQGEPMVTPSRLFIYYNIRVLEGTANFDAGGEIRDAVKAVVKWGAPPETDWPYKIGKFAKKPPAKAYADATKHEALEYARVVQKQTALQTTLASGFPVGFGFTVYDSFESDEVEATGIVPMPTPHEEILGGHAVLMIGYKLIGGKLYFEVRNSWGENWGDHGHFWMPAAYLINKNLAADFWVIRKVK